MGTKQSDSTTDKSFSRSQYSDGPYNTQESTNCCGCMMFKGLMLPEWQINLIRNCRQIQKQYEWARKIGGFAKRKKFERKLFIQEINQLKYQQRKLINSERQSLLNPQDIKKFKENLKQSFLVSSSFSKTSKGVSHSRKISHSIRESKKDKTQSYLSEFGNPILAQNLRQSKVSVTSSVKSFVEDTITIFFSHPIQRVSKEDAHSLDIFLNFCSILEKHMSDPCHPVTQIIQIFHEYLFLAFPLNRSTNRFEVDLLIKHVKIFLVVVRNTVDDFYDLKQFSEECDPPNYLIGNPDNLLIAITTICFKNIALYSHIFKIMKNLNNENERRMAKIIENLSQKNTFGFNIRESYCLSDISQSSLPELEEYVDKDRKQPYEKSIRILKKLDKSKTPIGKIKMIMECAEKITESISDYYSQQSKADIENLLDADQILSIFCYIIVKSKVEDLQSHLQFLQNFATQRQLISAAGYYCSVISAAIQHLQIENSHLSNGNFK